MPHHLYHLLLSGADTWNKYRRQHPEIGMDSTKDETETEAEWQQRAAKMIELNFTGANFQGLLLANSDLRRGEFCNADCRQACFDRCDLSGADFRGAKLAGCRFQACVMSPTAFEGCDLRGVRFIDCEGALTVNPLTLFKGVEILNSRLEYLCFESLEKDSRQTEFSITKMALQGAELVPIGTADEIKIAEVRRLN